MTRTDDLLSQAGGIFREAGEPGWAAVADRVIAAVRRTPRAGGWSLLVDGADLPGEGHLYVSENVLRATLAATVRQLYICVPTAIEFEIEDAVLHAVHIDVTGSYGTELRVLAARIRATAAEIVTELLGAQAAGSNPIDITVADVVEGDPLQV